MQNSEWDIRMLKQFQLDILDQSTIITFWTTLGKFDNITLGVHEIQKQKKKCSIMRGQTKVDRRNVVNRNAHVVEYL